MSTERAHRNKATTLKFLSFLSAVEPAKGFAQLSAEDCTWEVRPLALRQPVKTRREQLLYFDETFKFFSKFDVLIISVVAEEAMVIAETRVSAQTTDGGPYCSDMVVVFTFDESGKIRTVREHVDSRHAIRWYGKGAGQWIGSKVAEAIKARM